MNLVKSLSTFVMFSFMTLETHSQVTADGKIIIRQLCEICDDGVDNDDDGYIDCSDLDCLKESLENLSKSLILCDVSHSRECYQNAYEFLDDREFNNAEHADYLCDNPDIFAIILSMVDDRFVPPKIDWSGSNDQARLEHFFKYIVAIHFVNKCMSDLAPNQEVVYSLEDFFTNIIGTGNAWIGVGHLSLKDGNTYDVSVVYSPSWGLEFNSNGVIFNEGRDNYIYSWPRKRSSSSNTAVMELYIPQSDLAREAFGAELFKKCKK